MTSLTKFWLRIIGYLAFALVLTLVGKLLLAPFFTAHKVANSASAVVSKTLDANNVIFNYERFHDLKANYDARTGQIKDQVSFLNVEVDPAEKQRLRMEVSAMRQSCRQLATSYNQDSEKINRNLFKGASLPDVLDINMCEVK